MSFASPLRLAPAAALALCLVACGLRGAPASAPRPEGAERRASASGASGSTSAAAEGKAPAEPELVALPVAGSPLTRSRATVIIDAPLEAVRATLFDFAHYADFMPNYRSASIVRETPQGGREIEMAIDELGGLVKLRVRIAIAAPVIAAGVETYLGKLLEGNVRTFESKWQLEPVSAASTRLTVESLADPELPIPTSLINSGSLAGVREAILSIKARAERPAPAR